MGKFWKITRLVLTGAGVLLVLAVAFNFLVLPRLINSRVVRDKIRAAARQQIAANIDFKRLDLRFLPRPHVVLAGAVLSIPPDIRAAAKVVNVYPEIYPLFSGKVRIAATRLEWAELNLAIPEGPVKINEPTGDFDIAEFTKRIQTIISALPEMKVPGLKLRIVNSRVAFRAGNRKTLELKKVNAALLGPPKKRLMAFSCESDFWEKITVSAFLDSRAFTGNAHIQFMGLRPHELIAYLFPDAAFQFDGALANLDIRLKTDGPGKARARVEGAFPSLKLRRSGQTFDLRCRKIEGSLAVAGDAIDLALSKLSLEYPAMDLSARLAITPDHPGAALQVEGRRMDVDALRRVALGLLGRNETVQDIFDVVRGGKVPLITMTSEGESAAELVDMDRLVIQGKMEAGKIFVSSGQLDLKEASGEAVISRGILVGKNLSTRLGNSRGRNGQLRLGLVGEVNPFHLDIDVQADLSDLPPVLGRLVENRSFQHQLAMLKEFKGSAQGRLVLGENTADVNVKADVDSLNLQARYQPIPFLVKVAAGSCSYRDTGIKAGGLTGSLGTSSFAGLGGAVSWQKKGLYLKIDSGRFDMVLKDLLPWLSSYEQLAGLGQCYAGGKGAVTVASISLKGPLFSPRQWQFATSGRIADLVLNLPPLSAPVTIVSTAVTADNQALSFNDARVRWLDSDLKVSGRQPGYLKAFGENGRLTMAGRLGAQSIEWLSQHTLLPAQVKLRPLTLSTAQLDWEKGDKAVLTASVATDEGGRASLDLVYSPDELTIRKLRIDDQQSHGRMGFAIRDKSVGISFEGNLTGDSMDWILAENNILDGSLTGSFKTRIDVGHPQSSTARGRLEGTDLSSVWGFEFPVEIHRFSLKADGSRIDLQSADFSWQDNALQLEGEVSFGAPKIAADLRLVADEINGDELRKALGQGTLEPEASPRKTSWSSPIHGRLNIEIKRFLYAGYTWSPLYADLSLSEKGLDVDVTEAGLCGISTPGTIHVSPQKVIQLEFKPVSENQQLEHTVACLFGDMMKLEGPYNLTGRITGKASADKLINSLRGNLTFDAQKGRLYHDIMILNIMKYLDAVKIMTGNLKEIRKKGESFRSVHTRARLEKDAMIFEEMALDSGAIKLAGRGKINFSDKTIDFKVLVAVVKTINRVIDKVPLMGGVFSDMLSVPVRVKGDWKNPSVVPLAPAAVGAELTGIMKKFFSIGKNKKQL